MNTKFSIGVVVAIVLQVSGFVWWTAQQAQTIEQLSEQVSQLTSRMAVEEEITMARDLADLKAKTVELEGWISDIFFDLDALVEFAAFTENKWAGAYDEDPGYNRTFGTKPVAAE
jgi:CTP:phosphocholine cytidylyltransferase-like protein